jgi:anti-sigma factor RsiW
MSEMDCKEVVETITAYLDDSLSEADRLRFTSHLAGCPACREYLLQMRATIDRVGTLDDAALSERTRGQLLDAFRDWRSSRER